jgi:hypothetical protein
MSFFAVTRGTMLVAPKICGFDFPNITLVGFCRPETYAP